MFQPDFKLKLYGNRKTHLNILSKSIKLLENYLIYISLFYILK